MNRDYLNDALDAYDGARTASRTRWPTRRSTWSGCGARHARRSSKVADQIDELADFYSTPAVKCETASSGIASFLDAYRDLLWGMQLAAGAGDPGDAWRW